MVKENLEIKTAVLENEVDNVKDNVDKLLAGINENNISIRTLYSRMDQWDGKLSVMLENIKELKENVDDHVASENQVSMALVRLLENGMIVREKEKPTKDIETNVKVKIIWSIMGAIGIGVLGFVLKTILGS